MKKNKLAILLASISVALILVTMTFLGACAKPAPTAPAAPTAPTAPIKIGALLTITAQPESFKPQLNGIQLAIEEVGGVVGNRKVELLYEDCGGDPVISVDAARKLVETDKVDVIIGPMYSNSAVAVASFLARTMTPNICSIPQTKGIVEVGRGNVWCPCGLVETFADQLGVYAYDKLGYRTASTIHCDYIAGELPIDAFTSAFESKGGQVVQRQRPPAFITMDYSPFLTSMSKADCVAYFFIAPEVPRFLKQYYAYGLRMPLLATWMHSAIHEGVSEVGDICLGMIGSGAWTDLLDTDTNKRFMKAFYEKFQYYPDFYAMTAYTAAKLYLEASKKTGGDTTPERVNSAMVGISFDTPGGKITILPSGYCIGDVYIGKLVKKEGRYVWEPVYTVSQIKKEPVK